MQRPAEAPLSLSPLEAAERLGPSIRASAERIEKERRLPGELIADLSAAGLFRMCVPRAFGGLECDVETLLRTIETVSRADASTGWCVMIGATSGVVAAYLSPEAGRAIFAAANGIAGGVFAPRGTAEVVPGGYKVDGRWPFASGCQHCDWLMGGCVVVPGDRASAAPDGAVETRLMLFPSSSVEIIDTWQVAGLSGTGSHDIAVRGIVVPSEHSVSLTTERPRCSGPLYAFPLFGLLALGIAAVALGTARRALDEVVELSAEKRPAAGRRRLCERPQFQAQVAKAEAKLRAARAILSDTVGETSATASMEGVIPLRQRALVRLAATHATRSAAEAVDIAYEAGGGSSVYASNPVQRCFRDVHVATQHMMVAEPTLELAGRFLLGLPGDASQL